MAATVTIDQAGAPAGVAGEAREDLVTGVSVTLTAGGGPFLAYQWTLRAVAIDVLAETRSAAVLSAPTSSSTSLSPIDLPGNYSGRLTVDSGAGLGASTEDVFDFTFYAGVTADPLLGPVNADEEELPAREPGFSERLEHDVPDLIDPAGNPEGWARTMARWFAVIRAIYARRAVAVGIVQLTGGGASVLRDVGLGTATRTAQGVVTVTFAKAFSDALYAAYALPIGATGGSCVVTSRSTTGCVVERGDPVGSAVDADFVLVAMLRFSA